MPKTSKTEYEKRVFTVQAWIVEGLQTAMIIKKVVDNKWCDVRQAERLLKAARDRWTKISEGDLDQRRRIKVEELKQTKRSLKEQYRGTPAGIRAMAKIDDMIIKLEGLNKATEHVIKGDPQAPLQINSTSDIDYSKLPDDVLIAIINARKEVTE